MSIEEFLQRIQKKQPPAPAAEVEALERSLGTSLPEDYKRFLVACNGGYVPNGPWFGGPTPLGESADVGVHSIGGLRSELHMSLLRARAVYGRRIPPALLWIMDDPFGNAICLGLVHPYRGHVFFWDHEHEPDPAIWDGSVETAGNLQLLAYSFSDFVAGLSDQ